MKDKNNGKINFQRSEGGRQNMKKKDAIETGV
jgi:hypothetical protein